MGDEEFTKEELETLGEETESEEEKGQETQVDSKEKGEEETETKQTTESEEEKTEEEQKAEEIEEKENLIPQSRLDQMRREKGDMERKHDLLKRSPEEYYQLYPDEKPEEEEKVETVSKQEIWNMVVKGGTYDGKTLAEVHEVDALYAIDLYNDYRDELRGKQLEEKGKADKIREESEKEINAFSGRLSKETFNKEPDALSEEESKKIETEIGSIIDWMEKTGRGAGNIEDAYFLMNKDKILADTQGKSIQAIVQAMQSSKVTSISNKEDRGVKTGYESDLNLTRDQLASKIDNMGDTEAEKYFKNAPAELKNKFPDLAWD